MKTTVTKLKQLKTKTIYGFRRHQSGGSNFFDPTISSTVTNTATATTTGTMVMV